MSYFSLVAVLLLVLLAGGTNAARLHLTSQEKSSNDTSLFIQAGLLQGFADTSSVITYNDGFQNTRCLNTDCPVGFQPEAGASMFLGGIIEPVSQPKGAKQNITIKILKDGALGDWLVHYGFNQVEPTLIGRYPKSLFTGGLADRASNIHIGGVVMTPRNTDLIPMGSGYLPSTATAASFSNFQIIDENGQASLVNQNLQGHVSQPDKYSVSPVIDGQFFYGGHSQSTM